MRRSRLCSSPLSLTVRASHVLLPHRTGVFTGLRGSTFIFVGSRFSTRLRQRLFDALLAQEVGFYDATKTGDITSRLSADCERIESQVTLNVSP